MSSQQQSSRNGCNKAPGGSVSPPPAAAVDHFGFGFGFEPLLTHKVRKPPVNSTQWSQPSTPSAQCGTQWSPPANPTQWSQPSTPNPTQWSQPSTPQCGGAQSHHDSVSTIVSSRSNQNWGASTTSSVVRASGPVPDPPSEAWMPSGGYSPLCDLTVETVGVVGLTGQAGDLEMLFQQYWTSPIKMRTAELACAFVVGVGHQSRRALVIVRPMLKHITALPELDKEGMERLATLLADVNCHTSVVTLFDRNLGTKMSALYYHALVKALTESAKDPDLNLAVKVAAEMISQGYKHTRSSIRLLMTGFSRHPHDNLALQTAVNIMDWRLATSTTNLEPCFAHNFYSVLERVSGAQVPTVTNYLKTVLGEQRPDLERSLIQQVADPTTAKSACCGSDQPGFKQMMVVDAYTLALPEAPDGTTNYVLPEQHYVMFLYSAVRDLCVKVTAIGEKHPFQSKIAHIRGLLAANPKTCWVLSLEEELEMRAPDSPACVAPHCRMMSFLSGVKACRDYSADCCFTMVTQDGGLECGARRKMEQEGPRGKALPDGFNIVRQLPPLS